MIYYIIGALIGSLIPIGGIILVIYVIVRIFRPKTNTRQQQLETLISELSTIAENNPTQTIKDQLDIYQKEYQTITSQTLQIAKQAPPPPPPTSSEQIPTPKEVVQKDASQAFRNWYSDNSINLLLYLGAFLIVASASIFVSFQWETLQGEVKALLLSGLTVAFLAAGAFFYRLPKIKQAGATFLMIGALLIPFSGVAWFNFYFIFQDIPAGTIWFITSAISLLAYLTLARFYPNRIYTYAMSLALYSLFTSSISIFEIDRGYYFLSGILAALALQIARKYAFHNNKSEQSASFDTKPFDYSAHIIAVFSILVGLASYLQHGSSYATNELSLQTAIGLFSASVFYLFLYLEEKKTALLTLAEILFPVAITIFAEWLNMNNLSYYYLMFSLAFSYMTIGLYFTNKNNPDGSTLSIFIANLIAVIIYLTAAAERIDPTYLVIFASLVGVGGILSSQITKQSEYWLLTNVFVVIFVYQLFENVWLLETLPYTPTTYLALATTSFFVALKAKSQTSLRTIFILSTLLFFFVSLSSSSEDGRFLALVFTVGALLLIISAFKFSLRWLIYLSNFTLFIAVSNLLDYYTTSTSPYPLVIIGFFTFMYLVSLIVPENIKQQYRYSSFIGLVLAPIFYHDHSPLNALIASYVSFGTLSFHSASYRDLKTGYLASAVGLITYYTQASYLNWDEPQLYVLPTAIFFLGHAYVQRTRNNQNGYLMLNLIGLVVMLFPAVIQSFAEPNSAQYALLLGIEGFVLVGLGNSINKKLFKQSGIAAIVLAVTSQIYEYALSLPRWALTGSLGLALLGLAIYLLSRRGDES